MLFGLGRIAGLPQPLAGGHSTKDFISNLIDNNSLVAKLACQRQRGEEFPNIRVVAIRVRVSDQLLLIVREVGWEDDGNSALQELEELVVGLLPVGQVLSTYAIGHLLLDRSHLL